MQNFLLKFKEDDYDLILKLFFASTKYQDFLTPKAEILNY